MRCTPLVLVLLAGCSQQAEIVIAIRAENPQKLQSLRVAVDRDNIEVLNHTWDAAALHREASSVEPRPWTLGLVSKRTDRAILITVTGYRVDNQRVVRQARIPFASGRVTLLHMDLLERCTNVLCADKQTTCHGDGSCQSIDVIGMGYTDEAAAARLVDSGAQSCSPGPCINDTDCDRLPDSIDVQERCNAQLDRIDFLRAPSAEWKAVGGLGAGFWLLGTKDTPVSRAQWKAFSQQAMVAFLRFRVAAADLTYGAVGLKHERDGQTRGCWVNINRRLILAESQNLTPNVPFYNQQLIPPSADLALGTELLLALIAPSRETTTCVIGSPGARYPYSNVTVTHGPIDLPVTLTAEARYAQVEVLEVAAHAWQ